jgi:hypothetical protein
MLAVAPWRSSMWPDQLVAASFATNPLTCPGIFGPVIT